MIYIINKEIKEQFIVLNSTGTAVTGLTDGDFSKSLLKDGVSATETLNITEKGDGYYYVTFTPLSEAYYEWKVTHATYEPIGWYDYYNVINYNTDDLYSQATSNTTSIESNSDANRLLVIANTDDKIATQTVLLNRALGLMQENIYIDNPVYNGNNLLTSSRVRVYDNPSSVGSGSDILATYTMTSTYDSNLLETYKMVKE